MLMNAEPDARLDAADVQDGGDFAALIHESFGMLRRRYLTLLTICISVFGIAFAVVMMMTPRYEATARIQIDPKPLPMSGISSDQGYSPPDQSIVDTQVAVMRSRDIAENVVEQLNLERDAEFFKPDKTKKQSSKDRRDAVVNAVMRGLKVERDKATYLVNLTFASIDSEMAAKVANGFADSYIRQTVTRRTGTAEQQYKFLDKRLEDLSDQSRAADAALAQYRAANGLTETGQFGTVTDQQVAPLSSQLATAQAAAAAARSDLSVARQQMAAGGAAGASSVLNSPAIQALRANRAATEQAISQLSTRYGEKHPQTIQAVQQLGAIDEQIRQEAQRIVGELTARASAAEAQARSLNGTLQALRGQQASNARAAVTADSLKRGAEAKGAAYNRLAAVTQQIDQLAQNSLSQAQIVERASPPLRPTSPKRMLLLAVGLLAALALALGTVLLQELTSTGILTIRDVKRHIGFDFLASVPLMGRRELSEIESGSPADTLTTRPMSAYAEAFRVIRSALMLEDGSAPKIIAIASTLPNEGKTTSALSLARVMALAGERVLVIDGDVRRTGLGRQAQMRPENGLVEVLRDGAPVLEAIVPDSQISALDILTAASPSFEARDLFGTEAMHQMLAVLREQYDRIVFDTPPLLGVADARVIARLVDAVVLVAKWNDTPRRALKNAANWLRADHAPVAGVVLTMVSPSAEAMGALYYSRDYAKYYQAG